MSASIIRYRKLVTTDVASQAVNLAESGTMGHRVQIPVSVDDLNTIFVWDRPAGSDRPVGHFNPDTVPFDTILSNSLSKMYTDIDGMTNGLNFSSSILDANNDSRVRKGGNVLANDIVMCYVIYKCYGSSSAPTEGVVYNLQDAHDMLSNGALVSAIHTSMANEEVLTNNPGVDKGSIDAMFRDLLAADPSRFFDAAGRQIPGLFETVADKDSRGNWCFVENDKIEIAVQMRFVNAVTRHAVGEGEDSTQSVVIPAGSTFKIRLQLVATDTATGAAAKQEIAQANTSAEIVAQADATAKAAANAATAQRAATQAVSAAAASSAAVQARYQKAVDDNLKQATAVAKAQAALKAAQASLNQAIISGKTDSEIQNQRAAALTAQALAENLEAIADVAATDLQNAKLAADAATATLAAAQTASATAALNLASANAAAALAAKKKADDAAAAALVAKAAADAASDPITKSITDAESVILDPQTLVKLDAAKNSATIQRAAAQENDSTAQANQILATQKYNIIRYNIDYAISLGKKDSEIQILRSNLSKALAEKTIADLQATASQSTLTGSYNIESRAITASVQAKKDAAVLSALSAAANTSDSIRKLNVATSAFSYASTLRADAFDAANQAQITLDARISGGATFNEVQTRRKAVLDANAFLAERQVALNAASATMIDCQGAVNTAQMTKAAADTNVTEVNSLANYTLGLYQSTVVASLAYQAQKISDASANQLDLDVTNALVQVNIAKDKSASANAVYSVAKRNLDAALAGGKRLAEITVLQGITQAAQLEQQRSDVILQQAQANYNKYVPSGSAATAILNSAAEFQSTQIESAKSVTQAILYNSTLEFYLDSSANLIHAFEADELILENLNSAITGGLSLSQIKVLKSQKIDSSNKYAVASAKFNSASAAMSTVRAGVSENPNVSTILYSAEVLRGSEIGRTKSNDLLRLTNDAYTDFMKSSDKILFQSQNIEALKDMLATALANGKGLSEISQLQESLRNASVLYANEKLKYDQLSAQYLSLSENVQADPSLVSTLVNSYYVLNKGTVYNRVAQDIQNLTTAQIAKNTAETDLASTQAEYDVITELSLTASRQGQTTAESAVITSTLSGKGTELANKMTILNIANNSLSVAKSKWDNVKNLVFTTDSVSSIIQTQDTTYRTITSTLNANTTSLAQSISSAKSNMLTKNLTQTYIDMIHLSTLVTEDNKLYEAAEKAFNTAIAQGKTLAQIQDLRLKLQEYSAKKVTDSSDLINKTAAYQSSLQIAAQSQDAKGVLDVIAHTQAIMLEGAKSNQLLRNLIDAKNVAYELSIQDTAAQSELLLAQSALQIATANGTIVKEKYDAIVTASNKVALLRNKLTAANAAVALANSYVNMDPNVQTLQDLAQAAYVQQNETARANILSEQYFEAKAAEGKAYAALDVAKANLAAASLLFDTAISSGTDILAIQKARNDLNAAASRLNEANTKETYAKAALNTALVNANLSQTAQALITTARVTDDNVVAGANVTTEQNTLDLLKDALAKATTLSQAASAKAVTTKDILDVATQPILPPVNYTYTSDPSGSITFNPDNTILIDGSLVGNDSVAPTAKKYFSFVPGQTNKELYASFRTPANVQVGPYFILMSDGTYNVHDGAPRVTGTYTISTDFGIYYDNSYIYYYVNGTEVYRTIASGGDIHLLIFKWGQPNVLITNLFEGTSPNPGSSGHTIEEVSVLRQNSGEAAQKAFVAMRDMRTLQDKVLAQQDLVNKYTVVYQGTQAAVATNNLINYMLFNGFSYQQSLDRYVLNKDRVPGTVREGINIVLYSQTITPIDKEVYSNTENYSIGNLVTYPDDASPQYMCLVGTDPRGASFSMITGKTPAAAPIVWIQTQGARFRYRPATDLRVLNFTVNSSYSITVPLTGDLVGLQTIFLNSDINGNNTLVNGLTIFGDSLPSSTPANTGTIISTSYNEERTAITINLSQALSTDSLELYIKDAKTIVDAAVLVHDSYMTNLIAAGFVPVTTLGNLYSSFINRSILPTPITPGTPFALGTSTITPTSKGLYSKTTSYTTGDIVTDQYGSVYMCTVGQDARGAAYATTVGNAPVEAPGSSIYWYIVVNNSWETFVYDPSLDLELTPVEFGTGQIYWTSADFPANPNLQLASSFLTGYTIFGTGVYQRNTITNLAYAYSGSTFSYVFTQGDVTNDLTKTFYVKNGKAALYTYTLNAIFSTLSVLLASAASYVNNILSQTTNDGAATFTGNIATLQSSVLAMQTFYTGNTSALPSINLAVSIMRECVKAGNSAASVLNLYLIAVSDGVTGEINDLQSAKNSVATNMATFVTEMNNSSYYYTTQNLTPSQASLATMQTANISMAAASTQYAYYYTNPSQVGYTLFDTKGTPGGNYGLPMGTSLRAYIETPTQSNLWNIGTSDYTLEFIVTAGDNVNTTGELVDRFARLSAFTPAIIMGLVGASNTGVQFAFGNWGRWRGLLNFANNDNLWGPLYSGTENGSDGSLYMTNASNYYNFGKSVQNHFCEVRKDNVQTIYLNGNLLLQYSNIYSAPSNAVILSPGCNSTWIYGPIPPYWQIGDIPLIPGKAPNCVPWVGGVRNVRLSKEAVYTSSFNDSSIIKGSNSVFYNNLECLSTTILLLPMNDSRLLKDYSLSRLRVSTMAFASNIGSNIKYLSSFATVSTFGSLGISPVCYLPLSTNTCNIGTDGYTPSISGTVSSFSTIALRTGVLFTGNWANAITVGFNATSNLTLTCWYYAFANRTGLGLFGAGRSGCITNFYNTYGSMGEGSGNGYGWWNVNFMDGTLVGGMNISYGTNGGIGNSPEKPKAWNQLGYVVSTNTQGLVYTLGYINGIYMGSNQVVYGPTTPNYGALTSINAVSIGRHERNDGQQVSPWKGLFKEVMVFNKALSKTEILALYTEQLYNQRNT